VKISLRGGGVIRSGPEREMISDYIKRAAGLARANGFLQIDEQEVDLRSAKTRAEETALLLGNVPASAKLVILDERGKSLTSRQIACAFSDWRDEGVSQAVLAIGGADGFEPGAVPAGAVKWSFGHQTWPHKMVRVMAAEQIYRAMSIIAGSPYHRD